MDITSMSTKGQIVIPRHIRRVLGLESGSKLSVFTDGKRLLMKVIKPHEEEEFQKLIDDSEAALKKAKKRGAA
jgi:antitoxin PrlF